MRFLGSRLSIVLTTAALPACVAATVSPPPKPAGAADPVVPPPAATADRPPSQSIERLAFGAETLLSGARRDTLTTRVTVTNRGTTPVLAAHGDCAVELRAWRTPARQGEPVWRSSRVDHVCLDYLDQKTLAPGEAYSPDPFRVRFQVQRILGDSLAPARYYFDAEVRLVDPTRTPQGHHRIRVSAGEADLRRP